MLDYLMVRKKYRSVGFIGGLYEEGQVKIGYRRLEGIRDSLWKADIMQKRIST